MNKYLGNKELLDKRKIGFISCDFAVTNGPTSLTVTSTLGWAVETSKRTNVAVVSGFHSCLEKNVLKFLLQGKCGIIIVLARGMYRRLPKQYQAAMDEKRLLIIALEKDSVTRVSERTAHKRNKYVEKLADELRQIYSL